MYISPSFSGFALKSLNKDIQSVQSQACCHGQHCSEAEERMTKTDVLVTCPRYWKLWRSLKQYCFFGFPLLPMAFWLIAKFQLGATHFLEKSWKVTLSQSHVPAKHNVLAENLPHLATMFHGKLLGHGGLASILKQASKPWLPASGSQLPQTTTLHSLYMSLHQNSLDSLAFMPLKMRFTCIDQ